jgi:hypothetical protein
MKTIKILIVVFLFPIFVNAQSGSIEIEVKDSIEVKATSFEYLVKLEEDYDSVDEITEEDSVVQQVKLNDLNKMKNNQLEMYLKNNKFSYRSSVDFSYEVNTGFARRYQKDGFIVSIPDEAGLKKISKDIREMKNVSGTINAIKYEDNPKSEEILLKKLIEKAKVKAQYIATISNLTLGKIIEIKELSTIENSNNNFMDMIMKLQRKTNFNMSDDIKNSSIQKSIIVRFKVD